jgi:4-aminobutyrate aminotransferase-like enzyme
MPCGYRGPHKGTGKDVGTAYARYVKTAIDCIEAGGRKVAAFICESMLGCGGQVLLPDGYLPAAFEHVRAAGGVCIADEVQVGFGRAGTHFWAFETQGVVPDIVTLGKPMGNGHPLAAVVTTPRNCRGLSQRHGVLQHLWRQPRFLCGGHGRAGCDRGRRPAGNARTVGAYLLKRLSAP